MFDPLWGRQTLRRELILAVLCALLLTPTGVLGQDRQDEPLLDELTQMFQKPYLSFGALFQAVGTFQAERTLPGGNGFSIGTMRLRIYGELDMGFGYFVQTDFVFSRPILDAKMYYRLAPAIRLDAGVFKVPFSSEFLTYAGSIDFVNRSRAVIALAPGRQIGLQAGGELGSGSWTYSVGLFNGNRFLEANTNDNDDFLYAARIGYLPPALQGSGETDRFAVGLNAVYSKDSDVLLIGIADSFAGERVLFGLDARWTRQRWLLAGELIGASLDPTGGDSFEPFGWYLTGGYMLTPRSQALVRWDKFKPEVGEDPADLIILGYNLWPTSATEIQLNLGLPTRDSFDNSQLFINFQIGF
ncbi:MAG TPA: porin [Gemmatimonadota bacterium]|nr:porin [Gemmatimonadota bacterium]